MFNNQYSPHPPFSSPPYYYIAAYRYKLDLLALANCKQQQPPILPPFLTSITTPLNLAAWAQELENHPHQEVAQYLLQGISQGFRIGFNYPRKCQSAKSNMKSAKENPQVIDEYLVKECSLGRIVGPLNPTILPGVHISRFGVIPKKHAQNEWRMILDLSSPEGSSVNDGVDPALCSLTYPSVRDAIAEIARLGKGALLAKVDVKSAFRIVPVHPEDRLLLGMKWREQLFIDTTLPFGLRSAPKIFNCLADSIEWMLRKRGVPFIIHYLDDFLIIGPPSSGECSHGLSLCRDLCSHLGVPLAPSKIVGPTTRLVFLGIELDTIAMEARLPAEKLSRLRSSIHTWQGRKSCTKRELLSLIGDLQHASSVVSPGRTFLRRMIQTSTIGKKPYHHIRLGRDFRSDLTWWGLFLEAWNGVSLLRAVKRDSPDIVITSDASGSWGCGAFWQQKWFQCSWHKSWETVDILAKELLPIVIAAAIWGKGWRGRTVLCRCDNAAVVALINSGYCKHETAMHLLRCLFFIAAHFDFDIFARHIPGSLNVAADALSRNLLPLFLAKVPEAETLPTTIPPQLLEVLVHTRPDWTSTNWVSLFNSFSPKA